jgi:hypothetical protein
MNSRNLSGTGTRDPTNRAAADLRSIPRQIFLNYVLNSKKCPLKECYSAQRRNSVLFSSIEGNVQITYGFYPSIPHALRFTKGGKGLMPHPVHLK